MRIKMSIVNQSEDMKQSDDYDLECERCEDNADVLFKYYKARDGMTYIYEEDGSPIPEMERVEVWVCAECANEMMNGRGGMDDEPYEIQMAREEEAYEMDPINNPRPW